MLVVDLDNDTVEIFKSILCLAIGRPVNAEYVQNPAYVWEENGWLASLVRSYISRRTTIQQRQYVFHTCVVGEVSSILCACKMSTALSCIFIMYRKDVYVYLLETEKIAEEEIKCITTLAYTIAEDMLSGLIHRGESYEQHPHDHSEWFNSYGMKSWVARRSITHETLENTKPVFEDW